MENEEGCTIHLKVRMENDELVDKVILCPSCGGEARTFKACDGDGACYALLACLALVAAARRGRSRHATGTGPATRSWHACYAEIRWRRVQQTKRWKETWKRYGGRLRPTCCARERISRGLAAAPVTAPLFGTA